MSTSYADPYNIVLTGWQGVPVRFNVTVYSAPSVVQDISNWKFRFTVKKQPYNSDSEALYVLDWQVGASPAGASGNQAWEIPDTVMSDIPQLSTIYWDVKVILPTASEPQMLLSGTVGIRRTITLRTT